VVTSKITNGKAKQAKQQTAATAKRPAQQSDSKPETESEDENDDLAEEEEDDDSDIAEIEVKLSFFFWLKLFLWQELLSLLQCNLLPLTLSHL
jgi:hypothetical protein